jgi:YVTN family beta-propeller protein/parallel beta-helix repeat protein
MRKNLENIAYLSLTFLILLVAVAGTATAATLYVGPGGYTKIQDAVNAATDYDTIIVKPGTYVENVGIYKIVTIVSESGNPEDTIVRAAYPNVVFTINNPGVTIEGFGIEGARDYGGISLYYSNGSKIKNNVLKNNTNGIYMMNSNLNLLENNTADSSKVYGIFLYNCVNNVLKDNRVNATASTGILLQYSNDNMLSGNSANWSTYSGIRLESCSRNTLVDNRAYNNNVGLQMGYVDNVTVTQNQLTNNSYAGISASSCKNSTLSNNTLANNRNYGIGAERSNNISLSRNEISNNTISGIYMGDSRDCLIYDNFLNNTINVQPGYPNTWNITKTPGKNIVGGPYIGGNFWAKPDGTGFSQTHTDIDGDGICNEIYSLSGNIDYLPLANYTSAPLTLPVANFTATPTSGTAPLTVNFMDQSTGAPISWVWDFGDDARDTGQNVSHTYTSAGNYTVNLTVSNPNGTGSEATTITVFEQSATVFPVANFSSNVISGYSPLFVQFTDLSENADGWDWDFGDGVNSTEQNPAHIYSSAGNYTVKLTVSNSNGTASKLAAVNVLEKTKGPYAYITNYFNNTVSVIDTATNNVVDTVNVGSNPFGVAVSPDGTNVYITNLGSGNVSVIDAATNNVIATVNAGKRPYGIAVSPEGSKVYVTNEYSGTVSVIDIATNSVVATLPVGSWPSGIAVNPDGKAVYVANEDGTVSVIDTATNTVTDTVTAGSSLIGIAVGVDGAKVYVADYENDTVSVIDTATNTVTATVPAGSRPGGVAVTPDGTKVYVTNEFGNTVSVIDTATNNVRDTVNVGTSPWGVAVSPDGTGVYVVNEDGTVSVINSNTNNVTATVNLGRGLIAFGKFINYTPTSIPACNFSTIYGYSFNDSNINKKMDTGESGLSSTTINLNGIDTCKGKLISKTTKTNLTGFFEFKDVDPGVYAISESFVFGWLPTTDAAYTLTVPSNSTSIREDFGSRIFVK